MMNDTVLQWVLDYQTTMATTNATTAPGHEKPYPVYVGYICALAAVFLYGSNFVPIKKFYTGDGMFFQYILCSGIFLVGVVVQIIQQSKFYPLVMLGGAFWTTGNLCVVPIFKTIGMGLGMSTWGTFALIVGWASGRFGFFGTNRDEISNSAMNYAGVGLAFASILIFIMVKTDVGGDTSNMEIVVNSVETEPLIPGPSYTINESYGSSVRSTHARDDILIFNKTPSTVQISGNADQSEGDDRLFVENLSPIMKRIVGILLSVASGTMYGINFTPSIYVKDNYKGASQNDLDYVFAQFCGIYAASTVYFCIYCAVKKNKPKVYPRVILPGIVSGIMWALATTCWFIANAELSEAVSFPIVSTAPSGFASLFWGVFIFHEIRGVKNISILLVAFSVMASGAILAGLSR